MKHQKYTKLWISMILMLSCLGIIYITNTSFAENNKEKIDSGQTIPSTSNISVSIEHTKELTFTPDSATIHPKLSTFSDSDILKFMPNQEAMALLVTHANLQAINGNRYQPTADVSRIEFLQLSLHWLSNYQLKSTISSNLNLGNTLSASGESIIPEKINEAKMNKTKEIIQTADTYGIPLFSQDINAYFESISYGEVAVILMALARSIEPSTNVEANLENYIKNAYTLRHCSYATDIANAFALGLFSVQELPLFAPELPVSRSQTANLLTRLFLPEKRVQNRSLPKQTLTNTHYDYHSKAIYLFNNSSKQSVYSFNENLRLSPASLTKMMTVYIAIEHIPDLKAKVHISPSFRNRMLRSGASLAGFYANERVTYEDLLYATLLASGAEAAGTLAINIAGKESDFIALMNEKASELGMKNTHFKTVEGLDTQGQYTTAKDMAILLEAALKNPVFYKIATTSRFVTSKTRIHPRGIVLHSTILKNIEPSEETDFHILGGKSGTTSQAGLCWATFAEKNEETYILITLGAPLDTIYHPTMYQKKDALKIYQRLP